MSNINSCPILSSGSAPLSASDVEHAFTNGAPQTFDKQEWAAICVVGPKCGQTTKQGEICLSILGAARTEKEIEDYISKIWNQGFNVFDIWKVRMNEFGIFPPPTKNVTKKYLQKQLDDIMTREMDEVTRVEAMMQQRRATVGEDIPVPGPDADGVGPSAAEETKSAEKN